MEGFTRGLLRSARRSDRPLSRRRDILSMRQVPPLHTLGRLLVVFFRSAFHFLLFGPRGCEIVRAQGKTHEKGKPLNLIYSFCDFFAAVA